VTTLVPKIGVLTSTILYFSPFATVKRAQSDNALGTLNHIPHYPLTIMAISSLCWLVYGLSIPDPYVTLSNVPGCIASIWYVVTILPLLKGETLKQTQGTVVLLSAVTINIWTWLSLTQKSMRQVSSTLALYASFLFIILSGSPLSTIRMVVSTKNSKSILTHLAMTQVINTALWSLWVCYILGIGLCGIRMRWGWVLDWCSCCSRFCFPQARGLTVRTFGNAISLCGEMGFEKQTKSKEFRQYS
jgi:solute carrier family 50 protein (sugar transporter)